MYSVGGFEPPFLPMASRECFTNVTATRHELLSKLYRVEYSSENCVHRTTFISFKGIITLLSINAGLSTLNYPTTNSDNASVQQPIFSVLMQSLHCLLIFWSSLRLDLNQRITAILLRHIEGGFKG